MPHTIRKVLRSSFANPRLLLAIGATVLFWASAFAGIRASLEAYTPGHLALLRFLVASAVLVGYAAWIRLRLPRVQDLPAVLLSGFLGVFAYHWALNTGQLTVTAGSAGFLSNTSPVFTTLLATFFLGERPGMHGWVGIGISFAGAGLIALGEGQGMTLDSGALLVLLAALAWAVWFVVQKPYLARYSALEFTTYSIWAGTLLLLVFAPGLPAAVHSAAPAETAAVVYLGLLPSAVAYVTWAYVLSQLPASRAASLLYLTPPLALAIAWVWLGEVPAVISILGGAVTLLGVVVVQRKSGTLRDPRGNLGGGRVGTTTPAPPDRGTRCGRCLSPRTGLTRR